MAEPAKSEEEFDVAAVEATLSTNGCAKAEGRQDLEVELIMVNAAGAKASTTEEPREGKLHAGICVGGVVLKGILH